jgi:hypothetical protein
MRIAAIALAVCLVGCSLTSGSGVECRSDAQCGDDVCAASGECLARTNVRDVTVRWTVNGTAADVSACTTHPDLFIQFDGSDYGDTLRFAPVPCREGQFHVLNLPRRYVQAELGFDGSTGDVSSIDSSSQQVQFDLYQ